LGHGQGQGMDRGMDLDIDMHRFYTKKDIDEKQQN
jgi:hypothetical protein